MCGVSVPFWISLSKIMSGEYFEYMCCNWILLLDQVRTLCWMMVSLLGASMLGATFIFGSFLVFCLGFVMVPLPFFGPF